MSALVRTGARQIIAQAVEAELQEFLAQYVDQHDEQGRQVVVRNGQYCSDKRNFSIFAPF